MSFSFDFKEEILNNELATREEKLAFISAVLKQNGSIHIANKVVNIEIESEFYKLILRLANELKNIYDLVLDIKILPENKLKKKSYLLEIPSNLTKQLATDTGLITYIGEVAVGFAENIANEYYDEKQIKAYLLGITASSVNITVPLQTAEGSDIYEGGYSLEMRFTSESTAYEVMGLFAQFDIFLKKVERTDSFALYIRDSEMISDFMAFFGGNNSVIEINNIIVARLVRNETNRVRNCVIANIDKTVEAGQKQYLAIKLIDKKIGLDKLPDKLKEIALIRLDNPDFTLDQVAEATKDNISKSGINHRFRKIMEIAKSLEEWFKNCIIKN